MIFSVATCSIPTVREARTGVRVHRAEIAFLAIGYAAVATTGPLAVAVTAITVDKIAIVTGFTFIKGTITAAISRNTDALLRSTNLVVPAMQTSCFTQIGFGVEKAGSGQNGNRNRSSEHYTKTLYSGASLKLGSRHTILRLQWLTLTRTPKLSLDAIGTTATLMAEKLVAFSASRGRFRYKSTTLVTINEPPAI